MNVDILIDEIKKQNEELKEFLVKLDKRDRQRQKELQSALIRFHKKDVKYLRIIVNRKVEKTEVIAAPQVNELFLCQSISTNGISNKSPAYTLRTNTGYLIAAVLKEGIGLEALNNQMAIMPGETLSIEPEAAGKIDMTLSVQRVHVYKEVYENIISHPVSEKSGLTITPELETVAVGENNSIGRILD